jgi:hypothetical protein
MIDQEKLAKKLNLKAVDKTYILHAPLDYQLLQVPEVNTLDELGSEFNWLQAFYYHEDELTRDLPSLKEKMAITGMLWICWPKRSANKGSDLNDVVVRSLGLVCGLVDTKVAAIDETWSGLKFVFRKEDRL